LLHARLKKGEKNMFFDFSITVKDLNSKELVEFVRKNMPDSRELVRRARIAKVAERCQCGCGLTLAAIASRFEHIPTKDNTMLTFPDKGPTRVELTAFDDPGVHLDIKKGLCRIVYGHICRQLGRQGYKFRMHIDD
jgi:hypothetical protein